MDVKQLLPSKQQSHLVQGNMTLTALETCYSMVCHVVPMLCRISSSALENRTVSDAETSVTVSLWATKTSRTQLINKPGPHLATGGIPGMQEMEDLVLFEVAAGLVASAIMLVTWLVMTLRQGGNRSATMRTASARWRRAIKTIQGHGHDLRVLTEAKLDAFVDNLKFRIE
ncbi:hypothetical protein BGZ99_003018 [Dissophora globulifera]|uniref:Uncharacterized protein n=1 Tax=Dissophora globulifera TaxID=979702 RepID=A0A9P6V0T5_9FUNG|nr:hypothetical protein BGZ99_003018 [Dissophora globulifera]